MKMEGKEGGIMDGKGGRERRVRGADVKRGKKRKRKRGETRGEMERHEGKGGGTMKVDDFQLLYETFQPTAVRSISRSSIFFFRFYLSFSIFPVLPFLYFVFVCLFS